VDDGKYKNMYGSCEDHLPCDEWTSPNWAVRLLCASALRVLFNHLGLPLSRNTKYAWESSQCDTCSLGLSPTHVFPMRWSRVNQPAPGFTKNEAGHHPLSCNLQREKGFSNACCHFGLRLALINYTAGAPPKPERPAITQLGTSKRNVS
jgi:hypothetical protein